MPMTLDVARPLMPRSVADYVRTAIDRTQGRSMVMSAGGIAASEHPLASQAGAGVLANLRKRRDQPERAQHERPFVTAEPVVGLVHPVAQHQPVYGELVGNGSDAVAVPVGEVRPPPAAGGEEATR